MSDFNRNFLEIADIIPGVVPQALNSAANTGQWVNMKNIDRLVCVFYKGPGITGDDPQIQVSQATNNAGANAKGVNFSKLWTKHGGISSTSVWTVQNMSASSSNSTQTGTAGAPDLCVIEIFATDLDNNNTTVGVYNHVLVTIPQTNSSQYGCSFYIAYGYRYPQTAPNISNIS